MKINDYSWCGTVPEPSVFTRGSKIECLLLDVDGVMTDSRVFYLPGKDGEAFESKYFDSYDGLGFNFLNTIGIKTGFISGRKSQAVEERAREKNVAFLYQGDTNKAPIFEEILAKIDLSEDQIAYVGDDLSDIPILKRVGLACAVANGRPEVKRIVHFVTQARGGEGAVREVIELILKARGDWQKILSQYGVI